MWGSILTEWASLILRWLHVVAAIGWIGSSFYFIHLDLSLKPRSDLPEGVHGEAWQVHGGGFYRIMKYLVAPAKMPDELTWFKWEAYTTWLSGFALMVVVYYLDAELFLVDKSVLDLTPLQAGLFSFASLALAWLLSQMVRLALSRSRELLADAGSVELTKNPDAMISALRKIENRGELPGATSAVMELCLDNPREGFADLFATHPSVDSRVQALVKFAGGHDPGRLRAGRGAGLLRLDAPGHVPRRQARLGELPQRHAHRRPGRRGDRLHLPADQRQPYRLQQTG